MIELVTNKVTPSTWKLKTVKKVEITSITIVSPSIPAAIYNQPAQGSARNTVNALIYSIVPGLNQFPLSLRATCGGGSFNTTLILFLGIPRNLPIQ